MPATAAASAAEANCPSFGNDDIYPSLSSGSTFSFVDSSLH